MHNKTAPEAQAKLTSRSLPDLTIIAIHGELDVASTADLRERLFVALCHAESAVIIDLSGVSFCDATGLALLVGARRRARLHGLILTLAAPRPHVSRLLHITGLHRVFTIHATLAMAQRHHRSAALRPWPEPPPSPTKGAALVGLRAEGDWSLSGPGGAG